MSPSSGIQIHGERLAALFFAKGRIIYSCGKDKRFCKFDGALYSTKGYADFKSRLIVVAELNQTCVQLKNH